MTSSLDTASIRQQILTHRRKRLIHKSLLFLAVILTTGILFKLASTPATEPTHESLIGPGDPVPLMSFREGEEGYLRPEDIQLHESGASPHIGIGTLASRTQHYPYLVPFQITNDTLMMKETDFKNYLSGRAIQIIPQESLALTTVPPPLSANEHVHQGESQP